MDTLKIKAFLLIDTYKSFSKAAEQLSYTPSALSHMADALEAELGVTLFQRSHKGVELTEEGKQLREKFRALEEAENALLKAAAALSEEREPALRIGTYSSIALHILPEILQNFRKTNPAVKLSILVADSFHGWPADDSADVIFSDTRPNAMAEWYPMMEDDYVAVVPAGRFPGRKSVRREALYAYPFIRTNESALNQYFDYSKFKEIIYLTSVEDTTAISMIKEGIGVAALPRLSARECPRGVRILDLSPKTTRTLGFAFREKGRRTQAEERFIRFLKDSYAS